MRELCKIIVDIALWRRGPQDLPASGFLVLTLFIAYLIVGLLQLLLGRFPVGTLLLLSSIDVLMWSVWLWFVLTLFDRRARFIQTLTALLGVNVLLDLVRLVVLMLVPTQNAQALWVLLMLTALVLIMGRILMQATDRSLLSGIALSIAIVFSTNAVAIDLANRM